MKPPQDEENYEKFQTDKITVYIHKEILESISDSNCVEFNFGMFGNCKIYLL